MAPWFQRVAKVVFMSDRSGRWAGPYFHCGTGGKPDKETRRRGIRSDPYLRVNFLDRHTPHCYHVGGHGHNPERPLAMIDLQYFKRFRMELDLGAPLPPVPPLPDGYF